MTTRYVNTASSGGDGTTNNTSGATAAFSNLRAALDSIGASMSDDWTINCTGTTADTSDTSQSAWDFTTGAYTLLIAGNASSGKWDTGKYRIECTNRMGLYNNYPVKLHLQDIQVQVTVTNGGSYIGIKLSNANQTEAGVDCWAKRCIVKAVQTSGQVTGYESRPCDGGTSGTNKYINCLAIDCNYGFGGDWASNSVINCSAAGCMYSYVADAAWLALNCLSTAAGSIGFVGSFHANSNYNAEDDGNGAPGANSRSATTFTFVNAGADDFHLASTDAGAIGYGVGPSSNAAVPTDDIDGHTRSGTTTDIGMDLYYSAPSRTALVTRAKPLGVAHGMNFGAQY